MKTLTIVNQLALSVDADLTERHLVAYASTTPRDQVCSARAPAAHGRAGLRLAHAQPSRSANVLPRRWLHLEQQPVF
jgi:hypothetical protein